ncbi:hypothetical protein [Aliiroseovarius sp. PTFE2010]|uniref:hypothetical protein n=1 Tax=Aliiroseovarius sp. PTFE2010 TaxID=3417190 RepID=UPI003CF57A4B
MADDPELIRFFGLGFMFGRLCPLSGFTIGGLFGRGRSGPKVVWPPPIDWQIHGRFQGNGTAGEHANTAPP